MYHDDECSGGSGLGSAALFWVGYNWGASTVTRARQMLNNVTPRVTVSRAMGTIYIDDYNKLISERDAWCKHARRLEKEVEELQIRVQVLRKDRDNCYNSVVELRDLADSHIKTRDTKIAELQREVSRLDNESAQIYNRGSRTRLVNTYLERCFRDIARFGFHRLGDEPEYLELVQLTTQFLREYKPEDDDAVWPSDLCNRIDELSEKLMQKCKRT